MAHNAAENDESEDGDDSCSDQSPKGGRQKSNNNQREQGTVDSNFETPSSSEGEDGLFS